VTNHNDYDNTRHMNGAISYWEAPALIRNQHLFVYDSAKRAHVTVLRAESPWRQ
jgi:hypothetical protein